MYPVPVPTPYQPPSQGGNPYLNSGTTGPMAPSSGAPNVGGSTASFSNGANYPSSSINTSMLVGGGTTAPPVVQSGVMRAPTSPTNMPGNPSQTQSKAPFDQSNWQQYALANGLDVNSPMFQQYRDAAMNSANQVSQAQIDAATNEYNYLRQQLDLQKGVLQDTYNRGIGDVNTAWQTARDQGTFQKNDLDRTNANATQGAFQNYQTAQRLNREAARAAGGGESSAYLDTQGQTNNSYGNTIANLNQDYQNRVQNLDAAMKTAAQTAASQKANLAAQLEQGMRSIVLDQNASDFRKADAINQIKAQYADKVASINQQIAQFTQQLTLAKFQADQYKSMYAGYGAGYNPLTTVNTGVANTGINTSTGNTGQQLTGSTNDKLYGSMSSLTPQLDQIYQAYGYPQQ